jgi:hypothetical protein
VDLPTHSPASIILLVQGQDAASRSFNAAAQQTIPAATQSLLDMSNSTFSSPTGVGTRATAFNGTGSMADPMAAVFANVNRNLSGGASVLNPWGTPVAASDASAGNGQDPASPSTVSDYGEKFPAHQPACKVSRAHML